MSNAKIHRSVMLCLKTLLVPGKKLAPAMVTFALAILITGILYPIQSSDQKYDLRGNVSENYSSRGLTFTISTPRNRYFPGEKIPFAFRMQNNGLYPVTLYLHKDIFRNFTLVVRGAGGQSLPLLAPYRANKDPEPIYFSEYTATEHNARAVIIQPGETFERTITLNDYIDFPNFENAINKYSATAYFYPNAEQAQTYFIASHNNVPLFIDARTNDPLLARRSPSIQPLGVKPKEFVFLALTSEYYRDWSNYFKYINLHEVIRDYPDFARQYMSVEDHRKQLVIEEFKNFLMSTGNHKLIKFEIISETVDINTARVSVKASREIDGLRRDFLYTYYLSPVDNLWQITGVETELGK